MASFGHNPIRKQFICALFLLCCFCLRAIAQENQPTLEAALALTEPNARIEALQKYLQAQPDAANADTARGELTRTFAYLGETQLGQKNVDAAVQSFKQAIAAFPKTIDEKFFTEVAVSIPLAVSVRGYRTEAILLARQLEARFGKEPKHLAAVGEFYLSLEAPGEALRALHAASKLAPDDARLYRALGAAYRLNLNLEDAAAQYQSAIKADPKDPRAYFELANLQRAQGRYEVAVNLYNHQLSIEPQHAASLKGSALALLAQGKEDKAAELLTQAARITNTNLQQDNFLQTQLAFVYLARGNTAKARQAADAALAVEPRYSWSQIVAAEVELAEGKYFEAERHILTAMRYADFPTLHFMLGKIYLSVDDFEGALEQLGKAFTYKNGKYQTRLGGVMDTQADSLAQLLAPERKASLFQAEPITSDTEFRIIENLARFEEALKRGKKSSPGTVSSLVLNQAATKLAAAEVEKTSIEFAEAEASRKAFRWLYAAERLLQTSQAPETALKFSDQALELSEIATAAEGSVRDLPNVDRNTRLQIFRARALTLRGRSLLRLGRKAEAVATLESAIDAYGTTAERKRAQWQLAVAKESLGKNDEALNLYIAAYEPPEKNSVGADLNRTIIESVYRKQYGSLAGLEERIGKARENSLLAKATPVAVTPTPAPTSAAPEVSAPATTTPEMPVTTNTEAAKPVENPPATTTEKPAAEIVPAVAPTLPEARIVTLALSTEALPLMEFAAQTIEVEDAPLPLPPTKSVAEIAAAVVENAKLENLKPETPKEAEKEIVKEVAAPPKETVAAPPAATVTESAVTLPAARIVYSAPINTEFALLNFTPEFTAETEDAPPLAREIAVTKPTTEAAAPETTTTKPVEIITPTTETKTAEAAAPAPIELPPPGMIPFIVLPALLLDQTVALDVAALIPDEDVPAPIKAPVVAVIEKATPEVSPTIAKETAPITAVKTAEVKPVAEKTIAAPVANNNAGLSDSKVAEIEKAIDAGVSTPGGKKGNAAVAVEESAIGHIEGDLPIRLKVQPKVETPLPAGNSGHATEGTPLTNAPTEATDKATRTPLPPEFEKRASDMGKTSGKLSAGAAMETSAPTETKEKNTSTPLPSELEKRASDMGKTSGKLSAGAAMEIEVPDQPAGAGRKGRKAEPQETETEETTKPAGRPRRVKEN